MTHLAELNRRFCLTIERLRPLAVSACLNRLDRAEISLVACMNGLTRHRWIRTATIAINCLGNGWIYVGLASGLLLRGSNRGWVVFWAAGLSVLIAHVVYPLAKAFVGRPRPFDSFQSVEKIGCPLDLYSCPSGHTMTATAVFVVLGTAFPNSLPLGSIIWVLMAWARLASAHHYPSDVICGAVLGSAAAVPVCIVVLR